MRPRRLAAILLTLTLLPLSTVHATPDGPDPRRLCPLTVQLSDLIAGGYTVADGWPTTLSGNTMTPDFGPEQPAMCQTEYLSSDPSLHTAIPEGAWLDSAVYYYVSAKALLAAFPRTADKRPAQWGYHPWNPSLVGERRRGSAMYDPDRYPSGWQYSLIFVRGHFLAVLDVYSSSDPGAVAHLARRMDQRLIAAIRTGAFTR